MTYITRHLEGEAELEFRVQQAVRRQGDLVGAQRPLGALHLQRQRDRRHVRPQRLQHHQPRQGQRAQPENQRVQSCCSFRSYRLVDESTICLAIGMCSASFRGPDSTF